MEPLKINKNQIHQMSVMNKTMNQTKTMIKMKCKKNKKNNIKQPNYKLIGLLLILEILPNQVGFFRVIVPF